jgi:molecular chaperone GrpE
LSTKGNGNDEDRPVAAATAAGPEEDTVGGAPEASVGETGLARSAPGDALEALRQERDDLKDALLRRRAEFENYRRRVERDRGSAATEAEAGILRQLLGTVDNLERALAAGGVDSGLREGVELTLRELLGLLDSMGLTAVASLGERFDPAVHQAILHEPAAGFEAGTVAEVYRKGYSYKDRLLRPALVKVASAGTPGTGDGGSDVQ